MKRLYKKSEIRLLDEFGRIEIQTDSNIAPMLREGTAVLRTEIILLDSKAEWGMVEGSAVRHLFSPYKIVENEHELVRVSACEQYLIGEDEIMMFGYGEAKCSKCSESKTNKYY